MLGFLAVHLKFVYYNQTTIESDDTDYDVGWRRNVESVFGANPWLWLLPVFGKGPVGDGVHWPRRGASFPSQELQDISVQPGLHDVSAEHEESEQARVAKVGNCRLQDEDQDLEAPGIDARTENGKDR